MKYYNKEVEKILRWGRIGCIACRIAERLNITPLQALKDFYKSDSCRRFHDKLTGLYLYGYLYIAESYLLEKGIPV